MTSRLGLDKLNFLAALKKLKQRDIALILIVLSVLAAVAWWFYMYQPTQERIEGLKNDIIRLEADIQKAERAKRSLPQLQAEVDKLEAERLAFLAELPKENEVAQLLDRLREAARVADVTLSEVTSRGPERDEIQGVRPLGFNVMTQGHYMNTVSFLQALEAFKRFTKIREVGFSLTEEGILDPLLDTDYNFTVYTFTGDDPGPGGN
ncbi:MAG: type 4a pilus biogenesis protein PilO [Deinococcales bacterium]